MKPEEKPWALKDDEMITFKQKGDFKRTDRFFDKILRRNYLRGLNKYGEEGVRALASATPVRTGKTAASWNYEIQSDANGTKIVWTNSNINKYVNIAVILQYGHGTGTGGYVQGRDYINPAIQPIFDKIAEEAWGEVTKT